MNLRHTPVEGSRKARPEPVEGLRAVLIAVLLLAGWLVPATAYAAEPPQLSMSVDDGQDATDAKAKLDYTVTVTNLGSSKVKDLLVTLRVPDGAKITSADQDGSIKRGVVTWTIDVAAGKSAELTSAVGVPTSLPPELLRFAVIACSAETAKGAPLVCASDSNLLPAGAQAEQERQDLTPGSTGHARPVWLVPAAAAALLLLLVAAAVIIVAVRRRRARARRRIRHYEAEESDPERTLTNTRG